MTKFNKITLGLILSFVAVFSAILFIPKNNVESVSAFEYNGVTYSDKVWVFKNFRSTGQISGNYVYHIGNDTYYSFSGANLKFNTTTRLFENVTFNGLTNFNGDQVWTDGIDYYYSQGTNQYVLDVSTLTWSTMTWTGLTNFSGFRVWTDGTNYFYSSSDNYILDVSTHTWTLSNFYNANHSKINIYGEYIFIRNGIIYHFYQNNIYILDTANYLVSTGSNAQYPLSNMGGNNVWTDSTTYYYSQGANQYVLNFDSSTNYITSFTPVQFTIYNTFNGIYVFTAGGEIYFCQSEKFGGWLVDFTSLLTGGYSEGYTDGYTAGQTAGYSSGYTAGESAGYDNGYDEGYDLGYDEGYDEGYDLSSNVGYQEGYSDGYNSGYSSGYDNGYEDYSSLGFFPYDNFNLPSNVNLSDVANLQLWYDGVQYHLGNQYIYDNNSSQWLYFTYDNFPVPVNNAEFPLYYFFFDGYRINAISCDTSFDSYYLNSNNTWTNYQTTIPFNYYSKNFGGTKFLNTSCVYEYNNDLYIYSSTNNQFYKWNNVTISFTSLGVSNMPTINSSTYKTFRNFVVMVNPSENSDNLTLYFNVLYNRYVNGTNDYQFECYYVDLTQTTLSCALFDTYRVQTQTGTSGVMTQSGFFTDGTNLYFALTDLSGLFNNYTAIYLPDSTDSNIVHERVVFPLLQGPVMVNYLKHFNDVLYLFTTTHYTNYNASDSPIFRYDDTLVYSFHLYDIDMYDTGYNNGYVAGVDYSKRIVDKNSASYNSGYVDGVENAGNYTFYGLIGSVIDVPVNTFRSLLNFNVLGVNIMDFLLGLLTLAFVVFIVKLVLGGK